MRLPAPLCPWPPSCAPRACCVVRTRHLDVLCVLLESQAAAGQMEPHCWGGWLLSTALRYVADRAGPSPLCELPLPRRCRHRTAPPVAVAGSVGPFVCCCWMGDRRRHPRGWPELPVRAAAIDRAQVCRRPRWSVAAVPAAAAACLPSFLPLSAPPLLRPWLPPSLLLPPRPARWLTHCSSGAGTGALARRVMSMRTSHTCEVAGLCCRSTRAHGSPRAHASGPN